MTYPIDAFQIKCLLLSSALVASVAEDKKAIASEWRVTLKETEQIKVFHITLRLETTGFDKNICQIGIDDCFKKKKDNSRKIPVFSEKLAEKDAYYYINEKDFEFFNINSIKEKSNFNEIELESRRENKKNKRLTLKRSPIKKNSLSVKEIKAINNLDIKNDKIKKLFEESLKRHLENYISSKDEKPRENSVYNERDSLLEPNKSGLQKKKNCFCCFC
ncbi:MAG: hypothetical protein K1060chlam4_00499 [Candidatus Anoxychlamydiales bacterium]|nr:hypothetical protein [Candidatus Anoxychlamydiales bacterium]